jgi:hypothetical protein
MSSEEGANDATAAGPDFPMGLTTATTPATSSYDPASGRNSSGGSSSDWWSSMLQVAKEKSRSALEMIRTDLAEYKSTMATDTTQILEKASVQLKETTHQALSRIDSLQLGSLIQSDGSGAASGSPSGLARRQQQQTQSSTATNSGSLVGGSTSSIEARYKQELLTMRNAEATYQSDPTQLLCGTQSVCLKTR